jgi:hypothetical protein
MVQLSDTRCSCIAILRVSLVSFATITLRVASQQVFIVVVVYFVIESVRKVLDTPSYTHKTTGEIDRFVYFNTNVFKKERKKFVTTQSTTSSSSTQ